MQKIFHKPPQNERILVDKSLNVVVNQTGELRSVWVESRLYFMYNFDLRLYKFKLHPLRITLKYGIVVQVGINVQVRIFL